MSWRRILLLSIALVAVLGTVTWSLLQHSDIATEVVKKELSKLFAARTDVRATRLELGAGRLAIEGVTLADPTVEGRDLVRIDKGFVEAQADPLGDGMQPRHVVVEGLHIECGPTWPTPELLLKERAAESHAQTHGNVPVVDVRSGTATVHLCADERPLSIDALRVTLVPGEGDELQLRGSFELREPHAQLELLGRIDRGTGAAELSLTTGGIACDEHVLAWLARVAKVDRQSLDVGGEIASLTLVCSIPPETAVDRTPTFRLAATCTGVRARMPEIPSLVHDARIEFYADTAGRTTLQASVRQQGRSGDIHVDATVVDPAGTPKIAVRATGRDLVVDSDTLAALRTFDIGDQVVTALQPTTGRADLDLFLRDPHVRGGDAQLDLVLRDVAMSFAGFGVGDKRIGFPLPLVAAKGRVRLRDRVLLLEELSATIADSAGGGNVTLVGRIDTVKPTGEDVDLTIEGTDVAFGADLRSALATLLGDDGDLYDRLSPNGLARVKVRVGPMSVLPGGFHVQVQPTGASMRWRGFPYLLDDLRGDISVHGDGVQFDLTGRHGGGGLTMIGRIPLRAEHGVEDGFEAVVDLDRLAVDDDLRKAVQVVVPELDPHWRKAAPTGRLSGQVKVWRPQPDDPLQHDVRLALEGVDLKLPAPPWRAKGLRGQVVVQGAGPQARIDFDALRGTLENDQQEPAHLALLGHIDSGPAKARDLAFVVRDLELGPQLGLSLDELGALDFATWYSLQPSGRVDLVVRERAGAEIVDGQDLQVVVQLVDVRSQAPMLPAPAEHMTGELRIQDGELTFRDVRGIINGAKVQSWDGRVRQLGGDDPRTEIAFAVRARSFPVDDGLANLFSGPLAKAVLDRELRGTADVDGLRLRFLIPTADSAQPFSTTLQGQIGLDGVDMLLGTGDDGIRVHELRGTVELAESTVTEQGGALRGTLRSGSLSLFGHPFEAIETSFTADAERLVMQQLKSTLHGGELRNHSPETPALTYLLPGDEAPEGRLAADLSYERVDVFSLLAQGGWENAPYSGSASGYATLQRLDGNDVVGAIAQGTLQIVDADLGEVPLFKAINAQLPPAERPRFDSLGARFRLGEEKLTFEDLEVRSDLLDVRGEGALALDGYLDVVMSVENTGGVWRDPIFIPLIGEFFGSLVRVHLFGHLRNLQFDSRLLTDSSPGRTAIQPLPPGRPAPSAPGF